MMQPGTKLLQFNVVEVSMVEGNVEEVNAEEVSGVEGNAEEVVIFNKHGQVLLQL